MRATARMAASFVATTLLLIAGTAAGEATVSWTPPALCASGEPVTQIDGYLIRKNGAIVLAMPATESQATITDATAGDRFTIATCGSCSQTSTLTQECDTHFGAGVESPVSNDAVVDAPDPPNPVTVTFIPDPGAPPPPPPPPSDDYDEPVWEEYLGPMVVTPNTLQAAAGGDTGRRRNDSWPDDQGSFVVVNSISSQDWIGVMVRTQANSGYICYAYAAGNMAIYRNNGGSWGQIGPGASGGASAGDTIGCRATGDLIELLVNGTPMISVNDSTVSSGTPGVTIYNQAGGSSEIGAWSPN